MGGRTWAAKKISASAVGAKSEVRTAVALGGRPCANFERDLLRRELRELSQELERLEDQPDSTTKSSLLGKVRMRSSVAEHKLQLLEENLAAEPAAPTDPEGARMECGVAFAGTEISFGDEFLRLRHETHQCVAKLVCGEIVLM